MLPRVSFRHTLPLVRRASTQARGLQAILQKKPDDVVITFAARTAMGKFKKGQLKDHPVQQQKKNGIAESLLHPRPESSASSNSSQLVARLEEEAGRQGQSEFGVKQHISRSVRSLFMLSRASGIEREEFERLVKTELDVLGMMEDET